MASTTGSPGTTHNSLGVVPEMLRLTATPQTESMELTATVVQVLLVAVLLALLLAVVVLGLVGVVLGRSH